MTDVGGERDLSTTMEWDSCIEERESRYVNGGLVIGFGESNGQSSSTIEAGEEMVYSMREKSTIRYV
jgi:hypothetical protein